MDNKPIVLTKDQISIMGRPNFQCASIADTLIAAGVYAGGDKAEYKQAVFIHFGLKLLEDHGEEWYVAAESELRKIVKRIEELKLKYCKEIGSDSIIGLDCCDNFRDWLAKEVE